jgi:hypothetical protein
MEVLCRVTPMEVREKALPTQVAAVVAHTDPMAAAIKVPDRLVEVGVGAHIEAPLMDLDLPEPMIRIQDLLQRISMGTVELPLNSHLLTNLEPPVSIRTCHLNPNDPVMARSPAVGDLNNRSIHRCRYTHNLYI